MPLDDNNKKNTSGNTEDIFEIMEKYRANKSETSPAPKADDSSEKRVSKSQISDMTIKADTAQSGKAPSAGSQAKPNTPVKGGKYAKKESLSDKIADLFAKKPPEGAKKASESVKRTQESAERKPAPVIKREPRPFDESPKDTEANINDTALKNHFAAFSESAAAEAENHNFDTSMNIAAHLADTAPTYADTVTEASAAKTKGAKVKAVLGRIWYVLTNMSFLAKAVIYITVVLIISAYVSYYAITIANDVFAFVKNDREVTINIPENATDKEVAYLLEKNGLISYDWMFELYLIYKTDGDTPNTYIPGEKKLNATMNYNQLIAELTTVHVANEQVSITIPEGFTTDQIIDLFVSNGIGTREGFVDAINNYPYKHEFVVALDEKGYPETRKYRLEGYLYPDTYFFFKNSEEYVVINKLLNNFQDKFWRHLDVFKDDIAKLNMTVDEVVTLASMIQAEAKLFIDFEAVSYVFHNRLSHPDTFPYLQSDATIQYVLPEHVEDFTQEQLDLDNPYNTYKYKGLPPGAICNPGYDALSAAIYPDTPVNANGAAINAYYFVSNKAGKTYYAETKAQHDQNKLTVKKENEEYDKQHA